jgi:hypothetical protein
MFVFSPPLERCLPDHRWRILTNMRNQHIVTRLIREHVASRFKVAERLFSTPVILEVMVAILFAARTAPSIRLRLATVEWYFCPT